MITLKSLNIYVSEMDSRSSKKYIVNHMQLASRVKIERLEQNT